MNSAIANKQTRSLTGSIAQFNLRQCLPYLYLTPAVAMYSAFFLLPTIQLVYLSLHEWDGLSPRRYVGLENFSKLFDDRFFWNAFQHNVVWMIAAVIVPVLAGLLLALLLSRTPLFGRVFFRTVFFLPQVLSSVTVAIIWGWIYNPAFGAANSALEIIGLGFLKQQWLGDRQLVLPALFIAWSWVHYGFTMVVFIAALEGIDEVYFDAAKVDGANYLQQFRHIILPFIRGPLTTVVLVTAIAAFQVFDLVYVMTNGGPSRASSVVPLYMIDNAFLFQKVGYGSAIAVVLALFILVFSIIFMWARGVLKEEQP